MRKTTIWSDTPCCTDIHLTSTGVDIAGPPIPIPTVTGAASVRAAASADPAAPAVIAVAWSAGVRSDR